MFRPTSSANGRRSRSRRCRAAERRACAWWRLKRSSRSSSCRSAFGRRAGCSSVAQRLRRSSAARCASAAGSARVFTGRCARPEPRPKWRRNISPRWRPRSTSATSRRMTSFDMVLGGNRELLYAGLNRVGEGALQLVRWNANGRSEWIDAANAARPAPVESGMMMPARGPDHLLFRQSLSPDPALHALSRGRRYRRQLGQPDRRRWRRPGRRLPAGRAATAARCRSPTAAGWSACTAI